MDDRTSKRVILLTGSAPSRRIRTLAWWIRALVPAAVLVCSPGEALTNDVLDSAIVVNADDAPSGPLALASALAREVRAAPVPEGPPLPPQ